MKKLLLILALFLPLSSLAAEIPTSVMRDTTKLFIRPLISTDGILTNGSTTLQNFTGKLATTTSATTTNLYTSGQTVLAGVSGNVGVGTTSPLYKLDVSTLGGTSPLLRLTGTTDVGMILSGDGGTAAARNWSVTANNVVYGDLNIKTSNARLGDPIAAGTSRFYIDAAGEIGIGGVTDPNYTLEIPSNGILGFRDQSGSGTTYDSYLYQSVSSPFRMLQLNSQGGSGSWRGAINLNVNFNGGSLFTGATLRANIDGTTANFGVGSSTPWALLSVTNVGTQPSFIVEDSTSPDTTPFSIDASGNVGIGDPTPTSVSRPLSIIRTDTTDAPSVAQTSGIRLVNPSTVVGDGAMLQLCHDDADAQCNAQISEVLTSTVNQWTGDLAISLKRDTAITTLTEYFRFRTGGNFGAGTTTPNWTVQVASNTPYIAITDTTAPVNTKHWLLSNNDGQFKIGTSSDDLLSTSTTLTINNNGNVGIGGAATTNKLEVTGTANVSTTFTAGTSIAVGSTFMAANQFTTTAIGQINFAGRTAWSSPADGQLLISNSAFTDFTRLQLGGTTSAFPALGRTLNALTVIAADGTFNAKLGVGTSTPTFPLTVASSTGAQLMLSAGAGINGWAFGVNNTGNLTFSTTTVAGTATSSPPALQINSSGDGFSYGSSTIPSNTTAVFQGPSANSATKGTCFRAKDVGANTFTYWWYKAGVQTVQSTSCMGSGTTTVIYE